MKWRVYEDVKSSELYDKMIHFIVSKKQQEKAVK